MRPDTIRLILKEITESHISGVRFFHGMPKDDNTAHSLSFPAHILAPITTSVPIDTTGIYRAFNVSGVIVDQLKTSRSADDMDRALDKMFGVTEEIINKFIVDYGMDGTVFAGEAIEFNVTTSPTYVPVLDSGDTNLTGYAYTLTIRPPAPFDCTNLSSAFN